MTGKGLRNETHGRASPSEGGPTEVQVGSPPSKGPPVRLSLQFLGSLAQETDLFVPKLPFPGPITPLQVASDPCAGQTADKQVGPPPREGRFLPRSAEVTQIRPLARGWLALTYPSSHKGSSFRVGTLC